jgi:hypothetical protein
MKPAEAAQHHHPLVVTNKELLLLCLLLQNNAQEMVSVAGRMADHPGVGHEYMFKLYEWSSKPPNT